jgi:hypothetical protein
MIATLLGLAMVIAPPEAPTRRVEIAIHGADADADSLSLALGDHLEALAVEQRLARADAIDLATVVTPGALDEAVVARIWIELGTDRRSTVMIVDGPWERVLIRHVPAPAGLDEVAREELAMIVGSSVEALLAGARIGVERTTLAPTSEPAPVAPAAPASTVSRRDATRPPTSHTPSRTPNQPAYSAWLAAGWSMHLWSSPSPVQHGPFASLSLVARDVAMRPGASVEGRYALPIRIRASDVEMRLDAGAMRITASLQPELGRRASARIRMGGGLDITRVAPTARADTLVVHRRFWESTGFVTAALGIVLGLTPAIALQLELVGDVEVSRTRYLLTGSDRVLLAPWRVRPGLVLALAYDIARRR